MDVTGVKQRHLVVHDYGRGGLWAYVVASSPAEILERFPELTVFESKPDWMTDDSPELDGIPVEEVDPRGAVPRSGLEPLEYDDGISRSVFGRRRGNRRPVQSGHGRN
jgi:hypothetical protein